jgi:lysozyme family protein
MSDFEARALPFILRPDIEGGEVNDPSDPGGATNQGVSLARVKSLDSNGDGLLDFDFDGDGDVTPADIHEIPNHPAERDRFYREQYWDRARCNDLRWPLNLLVFDATVNHGVGAAIKLLQKTVSVTCDGVIGPKTILAAGRIKTPEAIERYFIARAELYSKICRRRQRRMLSSRGVLSTQIWRATLDEAEDYGWHFYRGWMRRLVLVVLEAARRR